jgi:hypothetical protein
MKWKAGVFGIGFWKRKPRVTASVGNKNPYILSILPCKILLRISDSFTTMFCLRKQSKLFCWSHEELVLVIKRSVDSQIMLLVYVLARPSLSKRKKTFWGCFGRWSIGFIGKAIYISQLIRYARACSTYDQFLSRSTLLTDKLMLQRFLQSRLMSAFRKFCGRYNDFTYFKRLRFDAAGPSGARTHYLPFVKWEHYH